MMISPFQTFLSSRYTCFVHMTQFGRVKTISNFIVRACWDVGIIKHLAQFFET